MECTDQLIGNAAVRVTAVVDDASLPPVAERAAAVKRAARRPVSKLLDRAFYGVYLAGLQLHAQLPAGASAEETAVYTVGNWDPSVPIPDFADEPAEDLVERLSHFYTHPANPTDWLRRMPNNPICNIAITTGYQGPCLHYTGTATSLALMVPVAVAAIADGQAENALLLAFDTPREERHALAHESDAMAVGVLMGRGAGTPAHHLVETALAAPADARCVDVLGDFVRSWRIANSPALVP